MRYTHPFISLLQRRRLHNREPVHHSKCLTRRANHAWEGSHARKRRDTQNKSKIPFEPKSKKEKEKKGYLEINFTIISHCHFQATQLRPASRMPNYFSHTQMRVYWLAKRTLLHQPEWKKKENEKKKHSTFTTNLQQQINSGKVNNHIFCEQISILLSRYLVLGPFLVVSYS